MPLAEIANSALLLDLDGTLLDLAPAPEAVVVPAGLAGVLLVLRDKLGGALAVISGRPVEQVDALLPGIAYAIAGEHGGAFRHIPGALVTRPDLPALPPAWLLLAQQIVEASPGSRLEVKARGLVFHYRSTPDVGPVLLASAKIMVETDLDFEILPAAMAWEIRPRGADKGTALQAILRHPPFHGRVPLFIGDDVTDWDAIRAAEAMGGTGLFVDTAFGSPAAVRAWLSAASQLENWPTPPLP